MTEDKTQTALDMLNKALERTGNKEAFAYGSLLERTLIATWLRKFNYQQIADAIEAEEHLR